jgi:hypothetical protein
VRAGWGGWRVISLAYKKVRPKSKNFEFEFMDLSFGNRCGAAQRGEARRRGARGRARRGRGGARNDRQAGKKSEFKLPPAITIHHSPSCLISHSHIPLFTGIHSHVVDVCCA